MESATPLILLFIVLAIMLMLFFLLLRKQTCPTCGKAKVRGRSTCPFCGSPYSVPRKTGAKPPPSRASSPRPSSVPRLTCIQGPQKGQAFPITSSELTIGRSANNMLRVEGMLVSRHHAQISFQNGQYILYDRESTNGTYVNGQRIAYHLLRPGDQIQIGPSIFVFQIPEVAAPPRPISPPPVREPTPIPSPPPIPVRAGRLGDYELTLIRRGGMATVYKGVSFRDNTTVAIKVLHHADPYLRHKFDQEGRIGRTLRHPHIAQIYQYGRSDSTFYIIMEYVDNGSLRDRLQPGRPLPLDFVVPVIGQTCEALSYAHSQGVIHRDIKPENIMFSSGEGVKVVDFGIAKFTGAITRTSAGMIVGTPYYMSYEQAKGQRVDPRSDIYSLGVVLYEMVTGRVPFAGKPLTVVHKHLTEQPIPPRRINGSLPHEVEAIVLRALAKDKNKRFQTAEEVARALGYTGTVPSPEPRIYERPEEERPRPEWQPPEPRPAAVPAQLVVISGGGRGRQIPLTSQITNLRRRDIDPSDMLISREHARIIQQGEYFWLEDLGSTNGTYLNGQRIFERAFLQSGDQIRLGNSVLRFEQ